MCTENHVCFGRIPGSQLREGANAGQHTPTFSLPPSHHCLDGEVYRGNRHYNVCEHVGLDTNQSLNHPLERDVLGLRSPEVPLGPRVHHEWDKVGLVGVLRRLVCRVSLGCPSRGGLATLVAGYPGLRSAGSQGTRHRCRGSPWCHLVRT
jgi:hypothetical protein